MKTRPWLNHIAHNGLNNIIIPRACLSYRGALIKLVGDNSPPVMGWDGDRPFKRCPETTTLSVLHLQLAKE